MPTSPDPLQPGFMLLQGNLLEDLRELLVQWMRRQPLGPLEDEVILVQSNGIAQWLKMALADDSGCGIAAAIQVDLPGRFLWQAYRSVFPALPGQSPYDKQPLTWRLYRLLGELAAQTPPDPQLEILRGFLQQDEDPRRRHQLALRLADLYDQYQVYRADWLHHWAHGQQQLSDARGQARPLPAAHSWQARLWQLLQTEIQTDNSLTAQTALHRVSRAEIHQAFLQHCAALDKNSPPVSLPRRVIVFGISSLPRQTLEVLQAIAVFSQVMVFASNPCRHYWGDLIEGKDLLRQEYRRIRARKLPPQSSLALLQEHGHPLLAAWGKQGRDYLHLLDEIDQPDQYRARFDNLNQHIDLFRAPGEQGLLQQLQSDILELRPLAERRSQGSIIDPQQDNSLQFLVTHSPQREVEVLHDQLLDAFEQAARDGHNLAPRDILVMVPDINAYTPHIEAVFGRYARHEEQTDPRYLPFHICDQAQRGRNTLLLTLEKLLHLPGSRFAVSELLDLLDTPSLRQRYGINEAELPRLRQWIQGANIRWGLDAAQRSHLGLPPDLEQNTWHFGLQRMLLGFATGESAPWQDIEPYAEVSGLEAAAVGPLTLLLGDLASTLRTLQAPRTASQWPIVLRELLERFFVTTDRADTWALNTVQTQLDVLQEVWSQSGIDEQPLPLDVLRDTLLDALDQPTLGQRFLGGSINFATLMPMRAIPFRQIWLLGMNDSDYPRPVRRTDFDLMSRDYRPGDRSRRDDDRYLFLEALLAARDRLVISWVGRNIRDNSRRPPSVVVAQLRDHLAAGWQLAAAAPDKNENQRRQQLLSALTTEHPLQAFSRAYFQTNRDPRLFTYAREWRVMHDSQSASTTDTMPDFTPPETLNLQQLERFLRQPVRAFYAWRLKVDGFDEQALLADEEPFEVDGLHTWALQQEIIQSLQRRLASTPDLDINNELEQLAQRLKGRGELPMPPFDLAQQRRLCSNLQQPLLRYQQLLEQLPQRLPPYSREWLMPQGFCFQGSIDDLRGDAAGDCRRVILQPSKLHQGNSYKWHQILRHWPSHLLAQTQQPCETLLLGPDSEILLPSLPATEAETLLLDLATAWYDGMQQLPPVACKTAFAFLRKQRPQEIYEGNYNLTGEITEHPALSRFWPDFEALSGEAAFADLCERLYAPLLQQLEATEATT